MVKESRQSSHRDIVRRVREAQSFSVNVPALGHVQVPRPEQLAFYGALGALAAIEIIDWPVALLLGVGHALMHNEHSRVAQEIGEALEDA